MVQKKVIGGREVYVEDRTKMTEAAREVVRRPRDPEALRRLNEATKEIIRPSKPKP